jgi:hypothetical protein
MNKNIPNGVIQVRVEICSKCETKCDEFRAGKIDHANPCHSCVESPRKWDVYGKCGNFGLGDAVAAIAQPIAKAIDSVAGTNIQQCGGCKKRQEALNKLVPNL